MRLSRTSHERFELFLREFFEDETLRLPPINIYAKSGAKIFTKVFKLNGITLGRSILIDPKFTWRDGNLRLCASKSLIAHELAHAWQYHKLGFFRFMYVYLKSYWEALKKKETWDFDARTQAYMEIPLEAEAREFAEKYLEWLDKSLKENQTPAIFP